MNNTRRDRRDFLAAGAAAIALGGAGASFPFPLCASWTQAFSAQNRGVRID
ncbi:MAG: twin-arginine translocation signal domain-containing protein [Rubrimonas sp.]|uniref:twin-arginine translocation signal domain-containing protein n=1 Tax=Rubrimonas sp. TaxID=2036015 RepID=UPI002FDCDD92